MIDYNAKKIPPQSGGMILFQYYLFEHQN